MRSIKATIIKTVITHILIIMISSSFFVLAETPVLEKPTFEEYWKSSESLPEGPSLKEVAIKMLFSLVMILAMIALTIYLIKRLYPQGVTFNRDSNVKLLKVIEKTLIAPKQEIYLVWAVDRILVLGNSNGNLKVLTEINNQSTIEEKLPKEFADDFVHSQLKYSESIQ